MKEIIFKTRINKHSFKFEDNNYTGNGTVPINNSGRNDLKSHLLQNAETKEATRDYGEDMFELNIGFSPIKSSESRPDETTLQGLNNVFVREKCNGNFSPQEQLLLCKSGLLLSDSNPGNTELNSNNNLHNSTKNIYRHQSIPDSDNEAKIRFENYSSKSLLSLSLQSLPSSYDLLSPSLNSLSSSGRPLSPQEKSLKVQQLQNKLLSQQSARSLRRKNSLVKEKNSPEIY